jgi:hypothetical protein
MKQTDLVIVAVSEITNFNFIDQGRLRSRLDWRSR